MIDKAAEMGLLYVGGSNHQKVSRDIPKDFDVHLSDDERRQVRLEVGCGGRSPCDISCGANAGG